MVQIIAQEMVVERRLAKLIKIIATSSLYLRKEIVSKGILSENEITRLQQELQFDCSDLEAPTAWSVPSLSHFSKQVMPNNKSHNVYL